MPTLKLEILQEDIDAACEAIKNEDFRLSCCCIVSQAVKRQTGKAASTSYSYVMIDDLFWRPREFEEITKYTGLLVAEWRTARPGTIHLEA